MYMIFILPISKYKTVHAQNKAIPKTTFCRVPFPLDVLRLLETLVFSLEAIFYQLWKFVTTGWF